MDDRNCSGPFPDPPLPDLDEFGRVVPPWVKFPNLRRGSMGWRMGAGEDFVIRTFRPWWSRQTESEREVYRSAYPAPEEWLGYLTIADFDKAGRMVPPWLKYPQSPRSSGTWRIAGRKRFLAEFRQWWEMLSTAERDDYCSLYPAPEEWRGLLS